MGPPLTHTSASHRVSQKHLQLFCVFLLPNKHTNTQKIILKNVCPSAEAMPGSPGHQSEELYSYGPFLVRSTTESASQHKPPSPIHTAGDYTQHLFYHSHTQHGFHGQFEVQPKDTWNEEWRCQDQTTDIVVSGRPALTPEPQLPQTQCKNVLFFSVTCVVFYILPQANELSY